MSSIINQSSPLSAERAAQSSEFSVSVFLCFCGRASLVTVQNTHLELSSLIWVKVDHIFGDCEFVLVFPPMSSSCWVSLWTDGFTCFSCHTICHQKFNRETLGSSPTSMFETASPLLPAPHWNDWRWRVTGRQCEKALTLDLELPRKYFTWPQTGSCWSGMLPCVAVVGSLNLLRSLGC